MGLSGLDSKKCQTILRYKCQLDRHLSDIPIIPDKIPDDIDAMILAYQSGKSTNKLAERYGCSKNTISKLLRDRGVNVTKCKALSKLDDNVVIAMYEEMHTAEEIAKHFKVNCEVVLRCLKSHGVKIRSRWDYSKK